MTDLSHRPASWKILLAFGTIYFVWGSTFLAIRIGVREVPPFLMAAIRFTVAGLVLCAWMRSRGVAWPDRRALASCFLLGTLMFLIDYSCLFWAEQRVPSGIAAVVLATIPLFITALEVAFLRTLRLTVRLGAGLLIGVAGVAVLMNNSISFGETPLDRGGALALTCASLGWSVGTIVSRKVPLPASKPMSAGLQMLFGGMQLFVLTAVSGEFRGFQTSRVSWNAWLALVYLIIAGSLIGYTAYVWLLHYESPTRVGTYAYVNPVIAVALGYLLGGENIGLRTLLGTLLILVSVIAVTMSSKPNVLENRAEKQIREVNEGLPAAD